uniref:BEN domain containing 7 n=1 Tax=Myripristis murdjan TaxID=586833 RepID=A0A667XW44_9TELE
MEIKRQITGMMRLLSDKAGRVYQRVGAERDSLQKEPQDEHLSWAHQPATLSLALEDQQTNSWSPAGDPGPSPSSISTPVPNGPGCSQYSTRSKALRILNNTKDLIKVNEANESPCCMCNCKGTLQAILQELRTMRRLMQTQKGQYQEQAAPQCQPRLGPGPAPRRRPRKRRPIYKVTPLTASNRRAAVSPPAPSSLTAAPVESEKREDHKMEKDSSTPSTQHVSPEISSEVRLAEDYDVFISKAQLDSILVNYTRSGSLLFRKLVCAFFDDATLANSLPNGKRKRGLNDNRKGLDQNIVGAIKVWSRRWRT